MYGVKFSKLRQYFVKFRNKFL